MPVPGTEIEEVIDDEPEIDPNEDPDIDPDAEPDPDDEPDPDADPDDDEGAYELPDGRKFKTQREALDAANALIMDKDAEIATANAYRQGAEDFSRGTPGQAPATQPDPNEITDDEYFADPKAAMKKVEDRVVNRINGELSAQQQATAVWNEFSTQHPDLAGFREDVEILYNKNSKSILALVQTKGRTEAYKFLAQKVRAKFQAYNDAKKPRTEMGKEKIVKKPGSQGDTKNVTPGKKDEKPVDFKDQVNQLHRKRRGE